MSLQIKNTQAMSQSLLVQQRVDALMLLLIRHGQPGPAKASPVPSTEFLGKPLTATGLKQAQYLATRLAPLPLSHLYCSNMARAYQTAKATHDLRPDLPFEIRPDLQEVSSWHTPGVPAPRKAEDRQRARDEIDRVGKFAAHLRRKHKPREIVAIVSHGDWNNLLLATLAGVPARRHLRIMQDHTSIMVVNLWPDGRLRLAMANCTRHLPASLLGSKNI